MSDTPSCASANPVSSDQPESRSSGMMEDVGRCIHNGPTPRMPSEPIALAEASPGPSTPVPQPVPRIDTPLPILPDDPYAIEQFIIWRLHRLRRGGSTSIGAEEHFMRMGLDSLEGIALIGDIEQCSALEITPDVLFEHPTPRSLAQFLARMMREKS